MKYLLGLLVCLLLVPRVWAQPQTRSDSLRRELARSIPDTNRVRLLLNLGRYYVQRPGERPADLDSALLLAGQAQRLSSSLTDARGQGLSYLVSGQTEREKGNRAAGRRLSEQALAVLGRRGTAEDHADALAELASYYDLEGEGLAQKMRLYEQLVPLLERANSPKKLADALKYRGDLYQLQNKYPQSLRDLRQALAVYHSIGFTHLQDLYDLLGNVSTATGDTEQGLQYGLLGLKTAEQFGDSSMMITSYNRIAMTYGRLNMNDDAVRYFRRALAIAQHRHDSTDIITLTFNIIGLHLAKRQNAKALVLLSDLVQRYPHLQHNYHAQADFLTVYTRLRHFAKAQQTCNQLLKLADASNLDDLGRFYINKSLVIFYLATRQYAHARQQLLLNKAFAEHMGIQDILASNHLLWFKFDSLQGNYPSAIRQYQQYQAIKASLLTEKRSKQIKELDVEYKTYEKQHNIQLLTQRNAAQQAQLAATRTTRNLSVASAGLLVLVLGLGYNRYRLRQRSARLLEAKQVEINHQNAFLQHVLEEKDHLLDEKEGLLTEKEWMLREIHHRVKNNLQIISSLLRAQGAYLRDETALAAIRESQNRVHAMALIHQKLYQSEQLSMVQMADYIPEIVSYLLQAYDREPTVVAQLDVEPLELDIALTVPLGLILNEAITNALKYGLPAGRRGTLRVGLRTVAPRAYQLLVGDDGVGLPPNFDPNQSRTQGLSLIRGLSKQIRGELRISGPPGVQLSIQFSDLPAADAALSGE